MELPIPISFSSPRFDFRAKNKRSADDGDFFELQPGYAGIRPKLSRQHFSDFTFVVQGGGRLVHCLGIESPGITAAMAIGRHVACLLGQGGPEAPRF